MEPHIASPFATSPSRPLAATLLALGALLLDGCGTSRTGSEDATASPDAAVALDASPDGGEVTDGGDDAQAPDASGGDAAWDANVRPHDAGPPDCPDVDLGSAVGSGLVQITPGQSLFITNVCGVSDVRATRIAWTAPATRSYVVRNGDPSILLDAIAVLDGCEGALVACELGNGTAFEARAGQTYVFEIAMNDPDASPTIDVLEGAAESPSYCDNGLDDDLDGAADCLDDECWGQPACLEICGDGVDNNRNGLTDCDDAHWCFHQPPCWEICDDGTDDDRDGLVDCADPDCAITPPCNVDDPCRGHVCPGVAPVCLVCAGAATCVARGRSCP